MTPLSRWKLSNEEERNIQEVLVSELVKANTKEKMETLVSVLMTDTERLMIAKRIFVFVLIDQELSNIEIAKRLHFTRATVDRLRQLYKHEEEMQKPIKAMVGEFENSELIKKLLKSFLHYAILASAGMPPKPRRSY